jgi:hypothetical protein
MEISLHIIHFALSEYHPSYFGLFVDELPVALQYAIPYCTRLSLGQ